MSTLREIHCQRYCPRCGRPLEMNFEPEDMFGASDIDCACGVTLTLHHPFDTHKSMGDSWSISYIR